MYLSRLILNPRSRRVQRELAQPYEMHRSIMRSFKPQLQEAEERVLWRIDDHPNLGVILLVQSHNAPDWIWLQDDGSRGYLLAVAEPNPATKTLDLQLASDQRLTFRLRANPTVKKVMPNARQGRRVGIYDEEGQIAWLARKGEQHGFRVLQVQVSPGERIVNEKAIHREDGVHKLELLGVQFDGTLQVTEPDKLITAAKTGIGSGKGFGFGLLSLAPVPF